MSDRAYGLDLDVAATFFTGRWRQRRERKQRYGERDFHESVSVTILCDYVAYSHDHGQEIRLAGNLIRKLRYRPRMAVGNAP